MPWSTIRSAPGSPSRWAMAKQCTNRDVSCKCRLAPLCPGFGGGGRAFSSSEKKPPSGLNEGRWEKWEGGRALSISHSRWAASVVKRGVPAAGSSLLADWATIANLRLTIDADLPLNADRENYLWRSRLTPIRSPAVRGFRYTLPPESSAPVFAARLGPVVECGQLSR